MNCGRKNIHNERCSGDEFLDLFKKLKTPEIMLELTNIALQREVLEKNEASTLAIKLMIQHLEARENKHEFVQIIEDLCILLERMQRTLPSDLLK